MCGWTRLQIVAALLVFLGPLVEAKNKKYSHNVQKVHWKREKERCVRDGFVGDELAQLSSCESSGMVACASDCCGQAREDAIG